MESAKVKIPYTNERVFPGGQFGFHEPSTIKAGEQRSPRRRHRQIYSAEFRNWMWSVCGPATLGLYRQTKYYIKNGREFTQVNKKLRATSISPEGIEFEFANPGHALLFKLTWGGL